MTPRDVIYDHLVKHPMRKDLSLLGFSVEAATALATAGYVILSPDEVRAAERHSVELDQCSIFASDVGDNIAKAMTDTAKFLRSLKGGRNA